MNRIKYEGSQHQRRGCVQWGIQGRGPGGAAPPYFLTTLRPEGRKKYFFETGSPLPLLSQGLDDRAAPLSEGVDPPMV